MFLGEYSHSIDAKGRLIVPAKYREELGEKFVISQGFDGCLYLYPEEQWIEFDKKLDSLPTSNKQSRELARFFRSNADYAELDKQGRVVICEKHRKYADIGKEVILAGVGKKIEVWSKERYESEATLDYKDIDALANRMSELGFDF